MSKSFEMILSHTVAWRRRYPGFDTKSKRFEKFRKFKDVAVLLRDGTTIYIDVFSSTPRFALASLLAWSPYGKHGLKNLGMMPALMCGGPGFPGTVSGRDRSGVLVPSGLFDHFAGPAGRLVVGGNPDFLEHIGSG